MAGAWRQWLDSAGAARTRLLGRDPEAWCPPLPGEAAPNDDAELTSGELYLAWEVAGWPRELSAVQRRALALLLAAVAQAVQRGSTRLPLGSDGAEASLDALAIALGASQEDRLAVRALIAELRSGVPAPLRDLIGLAGAQRPFVLADGCLYQHRMYELERAVGNELADRVAAPPVDVPPAAVEAALTNLILPRPLSADQVQAVRHALTRRLAVISGGPGTGKTSIVAAVVQALAALGVTEASIALAAPTGKAAQRMTESLRAQLPGQIAPAARTLHRLLGYNPDEGRPRHDQSNPLPHAAVIVDESSMIDLPLMCALLRAVPGSSRLVLLGDADQLPPVGPGDVFRALTPAAVRLERSYRLDPSDAEGSRIMRSARAVAAGRATDLDPIEIRHVEDIRFRGLELLTLPDDPRAAATVRREFLQLWRARWLGEAQHTRDEAYDPSSLPGASLQLAAGHRVRILCLTRSAALPTGAAAINAQLAAMTGSADREDILRPGTPIIVERNDYVRGLWNGDHGIVARRQGTEGSPLVAVFQGAAHPVAYPLAAVRAEVSPAWAVTVHKAQGSEHEHAALILPDHDMPLLGRQALYTALTRARRSVIVVGRRVLMARAVERKMVRSSGLLELAPAATGVTIAPTPVTGT